MKINFKLMGSAVILSLIPILSHAIERDCPEWGIQGTIEIVEINGARSHGGVTTPGAVTAVLQLQNGDWINLSVGYGGISSVPGRAMLRFLQGIADSSDEAVVYCHYDKEMDQKNVINNLYIVAQPPSLY